MATTGNSSSPDHRPMVEIRVHGVSGTPPRDMLDDPHPLAVGGDDVARFYRRRPGLGSVRPARIIEAFHWGRMTAGSSSKALWLVLVPLALINVARFTLPMRAPTDPPDPTAAGSAPAPGAASGAASGAAQPTKETGKGARQVAEGVLRLLGLALTLMLLYTVTASAIDLIAWQCGGTPRCLDTNGWLPFAKDGGTPYALRLLPALLAPAALILLFWWFGRLVYLYPPADTTGGTHAMPAGRWRDGVGSLGATWFWEPTPRTANLKVLHTTAGMALLTWLLAASTAGAPFPDLRADPLPDLPVLVLKIASWVAIVLLGLAALAVAIGSEQLNRTEGESFRPDASGRDPFDLPVPLALLRWLTLIVLVVAAAAAAWVGWRPAHGGGGTLPGFDAAGELLYTVAALLLLVFLVATVALAARTRPLRDVPRAYRPLWSGLAGPVVASVATLLAAGFTAGTIVQVARVLGTPAPPTFPCTTAACPAVPITVPAVQWVTVAGWALAAAAVLLTVVVIALRTVLTGTGAATAAIQEQYEEPVPERTGARIARQWRTASLKYQAPHLILVLAIAGGVVTAAQAVPGIARTVHALTGARWRTPPESWMQTIGTRDTAVAVFLTEAGAWVVTGIITGLVFIGVRSFRSPDWRRRVGVLWDLVSFWPRHAHPLVPPPYGGRAVLALAARVRDWEARPGHTAVLLAGHSQGSVIVTAATSHLLANEEAPGAGDDSLTNRLHLLTYGSQLLWAYSRLFPTYLGHRVLRGVYGGIHERWRNLYRWTDWLGAPVLGYPSAGGLTGLNRPTVERPWTLLDGRSVTETTGEPTAAYIGRDVRLRDPMWIVPPEDHPVAAMLGHSGYYDDPAYGEVVEELVTAPVPPGESPGVADPPSS